MYIVGRQFGKHRDVLVGWDQDYGTVCGAAKALRFPDYQSARAAARKARRCCMGWNHTKGRVRRARNVWFEAVLARH